MSEIGIDKVRASRDGHQYHEAWLARRALGLLLPRDKLCGIAVDGLSVEDQDDVGDTAIEVADATFYFGKAAKKTYQGCWNVGSGHSGLQAELADKYDRDKTAWVPDRTK